MEGADWRHPDGPGSSLDGRWDHPVVHVAYADAKAYAAWRGATLPSEAQWEFAARGGLNGAAFAWGGEAMPGGRLMANIWRGCFPHENLRGRPGTEAVGLYPANGHGLHDMIGNVWEWTDTEISDTAGECCGVGGAAARRFIVKGGSFLCADNYCRRYRPAARQAQPADSTTSHIGFRCARAA
jgi:formylglycine-generating enzyme required for sulfatase activity